MRRIEEIYAESPFYGSRCIKHKMESYQIFICRAHVRRLMRLMGIKVICLKSYRDLAAAREGLRKYFAFCNIKRKRQSLEYRTPAQIYFGEQS